MQVNLKDIPESNLIDYIKSKYPKVVFNSFNFKDNYIKSRALGFVISDNKLILGYIDKNGDLCKLLEPIDLSDLSNSKFTEIIKRIPIVNGFTDENKQSLIDLLEDKNKKISETENDVIVLELKKQLTEQISKYDVLLDTTKQNNKNKDENILLVKKEYNSTIEDIKINFKKEIDELKEKVRISDEMKDECKTRLINEKEVIIAGIKNFQQEVKNYIIELVNKHKITSSGESSKLNEMYTKLLNEKTQIENNMNILVQREKDYLQKINNNKSEISEFTDKLNDKEDTINKLMDTIKDIQKQLAETKEQFSKEELEKVILQDHKNKCLEKILYEKQEIIDNIKEYTALWMKWANNNKINVEQQKELFKSELAIIYKNLKKVFDEKNNYIKTLEISSKEKDKLISKLNSNISEIKMNIESSLNQQLLQLSVKNEELQIELVKVQSKLSESENKLEIKEKDINKLKIELDETRKLLEKNNTTVIPKEVDYDNCYSILQKFMSVNNMFYRKREIIKILDSIINGNINSFTNLNENVKNNIIKRYIEIKSEILKHIVFLDLNRYMDSPNIQLFKNKNTVKNVPQAFCDQLNVISEYWDANVGIFREQDRQLTNIYEDLSGAVRVYIKIKPLIGIEQKNNTVFIEGKSKRVTVDCSEVVGINKKDTFGDFYGIFDESFSNRDVYTGIHDTQNNNLKVNVDDIIETTDTVHPGLYSTFSQVEDGYSIVLFGYGLSGSGKTYSLLGQDNTPGLLHYGLANLKGVQQIKLKYLFEQYIGKGKVGFNPAFHKITGNIINLINEVPQLRKYSINEIDEFMNNAPVGINFNKLKVSDINIITFYLEKYRKEKGRVKKTPNNPVSSRSHLFMVYEITFEPKQGNSVGKVGYITIVDTAGRESPMDIYNMFIDNSSRNASLTSIFSLDTGKGIVGQYLNKKYADYVPQDVYDILREGFYINETINHLIYFFNKKNYKKTTVKIQTNLDHYSNDRYYVDPAVEEIGINPLNDCLTIPILKFLDTLSNKKAESDDFKPTKFIALVCARKDIQYCDQIFSSLEFAEKIRSS